MLYNKKNRDGTQQKSYNNKSQITVKFNSDKLKITMTK